MKSRHLLLTLLLLFGLSGVIHAETFDQTLEKAQRGDAGAQFYLGMMYELGEGVPENDMEAVKWYRMAAKQGFSMAQNNLADIYGKGGGVPVNKIKSYLWYSLAKTNGYRPAKQSVEIMKNRMTHEQIAKAQALAKRCFESNYKDCD